jgi:hypothetical protein
MCSDGDHALEIVAKSSNKEVKTLKIIFGN